jgi:hypothetical protein
MTEEQPFTQPQLSDAVASARLDPDRIKYIAQSFAWPRGLYFVAYAGWFAGFRFGRVYWKGSEDSGWNALWDLACLAIPFFISIILIPRYYTRRFGVFQPKPGPMPNPWTKKQKLFLLFIVAGYFLLGNALDHLTHPRIDPFLLLSPFVLLTVVLVDPWKKFRSMAEMTLVGACAIVLALWALLPSWVPDTVQADALWKALYAAAPAGIGGLTFGLYDHITLTRLIPSVPVEDDHE